ncbi:hypothetical protein [Methylobacterium sp. ap11]|uniref:hypothetical protein n=1 Tax=Methylobacterium sp. ap11 TaxID=1761799 RepID=UPI000B8A2129|nr:hypothetical protein [Methylobacterium sp. ap11]
MAIGSSTTQTPYLVPSTGNVDFTSLLSVGDTVPGSVKADGTPWRFVGIPDGIGAFDNGDGTATVLVNHETGARRASCGRTARPAPSSTGWSSTRRA